MAGRPDGQTLPHIKKKKTVGDIPFSNINNQKKKCCGKIRHSKTTTPRNAKLSIQREQKGVRQESERKARRSESGEVPTEGAEGVPNGDTRERARTLLPAEDICFWKHGDGAVWL